MKKKKSGGGGANWMDTYGDMVTLLLCFFVLLYSMSTINEEAWKAVVQSFNPSAVQTPTATLGAGGPSADYSEQGGEMPQPDQITQEQIDQDIQALYQALVEFASQSSVSESVSVTKDGGRIFVTFNDTAFFEGDEYALREDAYPILDAMVTMLSSAAVSIDEVRVLGHTAQARPDRPNNVRTDRFLASNRATNVVVYFQEHSDPQILDPAKLVSEGMGQWRPVDSNDDAIGRANNRRVEMIISGRNLEEEIGSNIQSYTTDSYTTDLYTEDFTGTEADAGTGAADTDAGADTDTGAGTEAVQPDSAG